jgi:hypothetical protein
MARAITVELSRAVSREYRDPCLVIEVFTKIPGSCPRHEDKDR